MMDETLVTVFLATTPDGNGELSMHHPGGPMLASVILTNEIIDYLMKNLPKYRALGLGSLHGMTGPH